jgi:hypothetical protein
MQSRGRPWHGTATGASETGDEGGDDGRGVSSASAGAAIGRGANGTRAASFERTSSAASWSRLACGGPDEEAVRGAESGKALGADPPGPEVESSHGASRGPTGRRGPSALTLFIHEFYLSH